MTSTADTFIPQPKTAKDDKKFYVYPDVRTGEYRLELYKRSDFQDLNNGKPAFNHMRIRLGFHLLVAGAEAATTAPEIDKFKRKGHGRWFSLELHPGVTPPGINKSKGTALKPSDMYEFLRIAVNDGEPLTPWQMGRDPETLALPLTEQVRVTAMRHHQTLETLVAEKVQFSGLIELLVGSDGTKKNRLSKVMSRIPLDEYYPTYTPFAIPFDPREDDDVDTVVCSVTGVALRGWEGKDGWITNAEWADMQKTYFGDTFRYVFEGRPYAAPFGPKHYRHAKEQFQSGVTPPITRPATIGIDTDDLPF